MSEERYTDRGKYEELKEKRIGLVTEAQSLTESISKTFPSSGPTFCEKFLKIDLKILCPLLNRLLVLQEEIKDITIEIDTIKDKWGFGTIKF